MKKYFILSLILLIIAGVAACDSSLTDNPSNQDNNSSSDNITAPLSSIALKCGNEYMLDETFKITLETKDNRPVNKTRWTASSDKVVLSESQDDLINMGVTAVKPGNVTIEVTEDVTGYKAECSFRIIEKAPQENNKPSEINISCNDSYIEDNYYNLDITTKDNRPLNAITWSSGDNIEISHEDNNNSRARIYTKSSGMGKITATEDITGYKAECNINIAKKEAAIKPQLSDIELQCPESKTEGENFYLEVRTKDGRALNHITWVKDNDKLDISPYGNSNQFANINALEAGSVVIEVSEAVSNYQKQCAVNILPQTPEIVIENNYISMIKGETKTIKYHINPLKKDQTVKIKNMESIKGFAFNIRQGEIDVTANQEASGASITLYSESLHVESAPVTISSSTDYDFQIDKKETGSGVFNDNKAHTFTVTIKKHSQYASYKLITENKPDWLTITGPVHTDSLTDKYTVSLKENKRIRRNSYVLVFLPGNIDDVNDKKAQKIEIKQDRNYEPENRTIKFFKGGKEHPKSDFIPEINVIYNVDDRNYKGKYIDEFYLYENGDEGWYNANKIEGKEKVHQGAGGDNNLCWAYTSVNALHWWLENNKEEYKKYKAIVDPEKTDKENYDKGFYNIAYKPSVSNSDEAKKMNDDDKIKERTEKSDIAKVYRQVHTENKGGNIIPSIKWYLVGDEYYEPYSNIRKKGFGLVKEIFKGKEVNDLIVSKQVDGITQEQLNAIFENAVKHDRLLLLQYYTSYIHAVNIWGYVVDGFGDVCEVYIGDNNLPSLNDYDNKNLHDLDNSPVNGKPSNSYILKYGLDIRDGTTYLINLVNKRGIKGQSMSVIFELDLGKKYFEEFFKKNEQNK